ncbi:Biotin carboxylase [Micromonospora sediminicola]|uniref:Biotin carboxylase n=1 Tax=Micromonospora sediminicola TaxID=946078 RepID=A0A1A9B986_9ACTN|nr:ATP-grasp domain-containing protein [Micromonospora sediminicola]SBT65703.1 Biotin carboxylase [Micromonospora sediminicola]
MREAMVFVESNTTGTGRIFAERARDLGLVPHLLTADASRYPYLAELDVVGHDCETGSLPAVVAACRSLARTHRVVGVTTSSELYVATAAGAARALDLPGEDPALLAAARSKAVQRQRFAACGVPSPDFRSATSPAEAVAGAERLGLPVVVKPISRSGSIGVRRCDSSEQVAAHTATLLATTADERGRPLQASVLVESYLAGPEFSVEVLDGEVRAVVTKHLDQSRGFLEVGHDVPADVDARTGARLADAALAALAALGLRWGAAHVELRLVDGRPFVVEVNPRLAGGMIPQALLAATGEDLVAELVATAAGRRTVRHPPGRAYASIRFVVPAHDGEVTAVPDPAAALALPGVVTAAVTARPGRAIVRQGTFLDRLGHVIATGRTRREAAERAERAVRELRIDVAPAGDRRPSADSGGGRP